MRTRPRRPRSPTRPSASADPTDTLTLIAGYRVLRRLASSDLADLYVGVAPERTAATGTGEAAPEPTDRCAPVVLKVFRPVSDQSGVEREILALTRLSTGRLPALHDLGTLPDGRTALVLEHVTGGTLSRHLRDHPWIQPGEAVTILAPIAAALSELHANGLVHSGPNPSTILFDASGRPVLIGLRALQDLPGPGSLRAEVLDSVQGHVGQLVRAVLDQVHPDTSSGPARRAVERWCGPHGRGEPAGTVDELEHLLFAWADAGPVRLDRARGPADGKRSEVSGELLRRSLPDPVTNSAPAATVHGHAEESGWERMVGASSACARAVVGRVGALKPPAALGGFIGAVRSARRGPLVLAAATVVVSTGLLLTALDAPGTMSAPEATPPTTIASSADADPADMSDEVITGDDPVLAVSVLLRLRWGCLQDVSVICLDGVHQAQSAALAADTHALRMVQQGGGAPVLEPLETWSAALVERTGDAALVSLHAPDPERQPASVLVVKGEAGWRIREVFDY
ncbi:protein kinase [Cryobacterium cryoconiti]|uniref:Protein kinase domain-containing protein n=1 Tax=Cryobacterium cryoconiti TaxID=1259239 RepID=A0A4Y8JX83_9MICO|nr:protein kinase [Cryobacterium cryoconiti]TFD33271.1 hypothetical protein E3T49_03020 [Cryobacterium cryoconiti]